VVEVDQKPIGRTPRSTPATYIGVLPLIRELFAELPESKMRGYSPGWFSFNIPGGRCEACQGQGQVCLSMHFMPDVFVPCEVCHEKRFSPEAQKVQYKGKSISEVLEMTAAEALEFFQNHRLIRQKLELLCRVGLDYITLGQSSTTLSGGEAQRVKLAYELGKRSTGKTLYILDEPTTGLHFEDVRKLLELLHELVDQGNTVVVIEHQLDVIASADFVIDLGPGAGPKGGELVATGSPLEVAQAPSSRTGQYLKKYFEQQGHEVSKKVIKTSASQFV
jgi:excinuclease ABC subunit A